MISHSEMMKFAERSKGLGVVTCSGGEVASSGGLVASSGGVVASSGGVVASSGGMVAFGGDVTAVSNVEMCAFKTFAKLNRFIVGVEMGLKGEKLKQELVKRLGRFLENFLNLFLPDISCFFYLSGSKTKRHYHVFY